MRKISTILILIISLYACKSSENTDNISDSVVSENVIKSNDKMKEETNSIMDLPDTKDVLVLRTDFSSDKKWENICDLISNPENDFGFKPIVEFLSDNKYEGLEIDKLLILKDKYKHLFIFIVDSVTIEHSEHPILCIDLYDKPGESFRVIPSEMWGVENNLSISNMDFEEFSNSTDKDGIHRGFK